MDHTTSFASCVLLFQDGEKLYDDRLIRPNTINTENTMKHDTHHDTHHMNQNHDDGKQLRLDRFSPPSRPTHVLHNFNCIITRTSLSPLVVSPVMDSLHVPRCCLRPLFSSGTACPSAIFGVVSTGSKDAAVE